MPIPLTLNWEAVKIACATQSKAEVARAFGIDPNAIRQRAYREGWFKTPKTTAIESKPSPATITLETARVKEEAIQRSTEVAADYMATNRMRFQRSIASAISKASEHVDNLSPAEVFQKADKLSNLVKSGNQIHGLEKNEQQVLVNLDFISNMQDAKPAIEIVDTGL